MTKLGAGLLRFEPASLELEIPAGGAVRVIDEHHAILILEPHRLLLDYFHVLANKARTQNMNHERHHGNPGKDVPRRTKIEPAKIAPDRSHRGAAREPIASRPDMFESHVGQDEIDGGGRRLSGDEFQDLIWRAIGCFFE